MLVGFSAAVEHRNTEIAAQQAQLAAAAAARSELEAALAAAHTGQAEAAAIATADATAAAATAWQRRVDQLEEQLLLGASEREVMVEVRKTEPKN
jgi:hypothetical protein